MNNIDPKIWGPPTWDFLHYVTLSYPDFPDEDDKKNIKAFFLLIGKVLPCQNCRNNYYKHINIHKITDEVVSNRYNLVNWLITVHNEVNKSNNKPLLTYEKVLEKYLRRKNKCLLPYNTMFIIFIVMFISIVILLFYKNYKRS